MAKAIGSKHVGGSIGRQRGGEGCHWRERVIMYSRGDDTPSGIRELLRGMREPMEKNDTCFEKTRFE